MKPCTPWATIADLCHPCSGLYDLDDALMDDKLLQASELLFQLSGQQFAGLCTDKVRPCTLNGWAGWQDNWNGVLNDASSRILMGGWFLACGCRSVHSCSCRNLPAIQLLDFTKSITEVKIDGIILSPSAYELRGNDLVRIDGQSFPCCTDDFFITFTHGIEPPSIGVTAAAVLACELYLACDPSGKEKCRLPRNIASVARQGVSVIFQSLVTPGAVIRTGIWEIDLFLEAYNPKGHTARSVILSPDVDESLERVT